MYLIIARIDEPGSSADRPKQVLRFFGRPTLEEAGKCVDMFDISNSKHPRVGVYRLDEKGEFLQVVPTPGMMRG